MSDAKPLYIPAERYGEAIGILAREEIPVDASPIGKSFHDLVVEKDAARNPTWAEVREARMRERKYPYNPIKGETWRERIVRILFHKLPYALRYERRELLTPWRGPLSRLRWKRQRMQRGWSEYDWWSIDKHFAVMIAEVARKYRDEGHGYPFMEGEDIDNPLPEGQAVTKWNTILTEMADGFDGYAKETLPVDSPAFKRAMELFAKWFPALWD